MKALPYHLVDVFTDTRFGGNQLAVFTDINDLSTQTMQTVARELNLSESVFIFPPQDTANQCRLRIFTPAMELPMAGHPTVGAAYVLQHEGVLPQEGQVNFEEEVGVIAVDLSRQDNRPFAYMSQPTPEFSAVRSQRADYAELLSIDEGDLHPDYPVQGVSSGVPFLYIPIRNLEVIRRVKLRLDIWDTLLKGDSHPQVMVLTPETELPDATVHTRMFSPPMGITEDPATGAASGPLGTYLVEHGAVALEDAGRIISEQGIEMGRPSLIHIQVTKNNNKYSVKVGGTSVYIGAGHILVE